MEIVVIFLFLILCSVIFNANVISPVFLFSIFIVLLYLIPFLTLWDAFLKLHLVSDSYLFGFFLIIILSYIGFITGDKIAGNARSVNNKYRLIVDIRKLERYAIYCGLIGVAGYGTFVVNSGLTMYLRGHGSGDFSIGGYVYELRYFIFSAITLLLNLLLNKSISKMGKYLLYLFCIILSLDAIIQQQRGSWIRFGIIFLLSFMFHNMKGEVRFKDLFRKYKTVFISAVFLGFLLVFTVQVRKFAKVGQPFSTQVSKTVIFIYDNPSVIFGGSGMDEGNEFVTALNAYQAGSISGQFDFGYKWLYGFLNFVPRNLWKNKPTLVDFSVNEFDLIDKYSSIQHARGSAVTGIIDAYFRFAWFTPLFFVVAGYYFKFLYNKSVYDIRYRFFYICMYIGFFYFITQDIFPLIIFTLYMYIPIYFIVRKTVKKIK